MQNYIPHLSNARNSKKMLDMRQECGDDRAAAVYGTYWMIIERLRDEEDFTCETNYKRLAFDFRLSVELVRSTVEDFGLFDISEDGKTFTAHGIEERLAIASAISAIKSEAGRKGAAARWGKDKNPDRMAQNGNNMAGAISANGYKINKKKINKNKVNNSSPSSSSPSSPSEVEEWEKEEKEKFISYLFFENMASPEAEFQKFVEYNSSGDRNWEAMSHEDRLFALHGWHQQPERPKRFSEGFLSFWREIYDALVALHAPPDIRLDALADELRWTKQGDCIKLHCSDALHFFLERNLDTFKPIIRNFQKSANYGANFYYDPY